jgi:hypothetical protein
MKLKPRSMGLTVLVAVLITISTACNKKVTVANVPTGISQTTVQEWFQAAGAFQLGAKYTRQLTEATITLHSQFPDELTYQKTLTAFGTASQIGIQASHYLEGVPQNWNQSIVTQVTNYLNLFAAQVQISLTDGLAHVKNQQSLASLQNTITLLQGVIKTIQALVTPSTVGTTGMVTWPTLWATEPEPAAWYILKTGGV